MEQNPAVALFLALGLIIAASRVGGAIARRFGQPRVLGELVFGVLLGPTLLNLLNAPILHGVDLHETIRQLAELGVLLLMFIIGLEVNIKELASVGKVAGFAGFIGAVVPVILTMPLLLLFGYSWQPALFAGVTLAATSVSISAQVLLELGVLRTKVGNALLATALIDDVLAILLVSLAVAVSVGGAQAIQIGDLVGIIVRMAVYIAGAFVAAWFVLPRIINLLDKMPAVIQSYGHPAIALVVALLFGWSAQEFGGVAAITGAFIAGVGYSRVKEDARHQVVVAMSSIAYSFLVPIFFIDVGLETDLRAFPLSALPLAIGLLIVALISKVGGCSLGARWGGFAQRESLQLGVCMISRGEVGLIIATLGISTGVFRADQPLYTALFLVILLTTVVTPILVRQIFPAEKAAA
jgi:Kef-type K+ transport system membrane component KefB